jgi:molybdopterin-guanine dinucleotide biosynthesis protein A
MTGVAILAGGEATRLPGKLLLDAGGVPLLLRAYRNVGPGRETVISCAATFPAALDALLPVPLIVDREPRRGPLGGVVTALGRMRSRWVFVLAGDTPFAGSALLERLEAARRPGDEAVVPVRQRDGRRQLEPLAALYDRIAFVRAGVEALRRGAGSMRAALAGLRAHTLAVEDSRAFINLNSPADLPSFLTALSEESP